MRGEVFIDSGAFVALLDRSDASHAEVESLFSEPPLGWATSYLVVAETYGWFLHRLGEPAARVFRECLAEMTDLTLLDADSRHHSLVGRKIDHLRGKKLTYVDASCLVWVRERRIETVWGTDQDLAVEGAIVSPGPPRR